MNEEPRRYRKTQDRASLLFDMLVAAGDEGLAKSDIRSQTGWTDRQFAVAKDIIRETLADLHKEPIIYNSREAVWKMNAPKDEIKEFIELRQQAKAKQIMNDLTAVVVPYLAKFGNREVAMRYAERSLRRAVEDLKDVMA